MSFFSIFTTFIYMLILISDSRALSFQFYDACTNKPVIKGRIIFDINNLTVGDISIKLLDKYEIPYLGTESGLNSLFESPSGFDALEVINNEDLRAYGPCYKVNGKIIDKMPDELYFSKQSDEIIWYVGYANYMSGVWTSYCNPSHLLRSEFICKKTEDIK